MSDFRFKLDTKSFFFNIQNDNEKGHTATVATVLKQGNSVNQSLPLFQSCSSNVSVENAGLSFECSKNSKSIVRITNILVFDQIYLNGEKLEVESKFCMYLKEEVDPDRYQYGRIKLHYPSSMKYDDFKYNIDNRSVLKTISERLHNYAFLISEIEIFDRPGKINFITSLIGPKGIPYSKVFLDYKGNAREKFTKVFNEVADNYEIEAPKMREIGVPGIQKIDPSTYLQVNDYCKSRAIEIVLNQLDKLGHKDVQVHTYTYPYDVCDIETMKNGRKNYYIICFTSTKQDYFCLSRTKGNFMCDFEGTAFVILVKDVLSVQPLIQSFSMDDLREMNRDLEVVRYTK